MVVIVSNRKINNMKYNKYRIDHAREDHKLAYSNDHKTLAQTLVMINGVDAERMIESLRAAETVFLKLAHPEAALHIDPTDLKRQSEKASNLAMILRTAINNRQ